MNRLKIAALFSLLYVAAVFAKIFAKDLDHHADHDEYTDY